MALIQESHKKINQGFIVKTKDISLETLKQNIRQAIKDQHKKEGFDGFSYFMDSTHKIHSSSNIDHTGYIHEFIVYKTTSRTFFEIIEPHNYRNNENGAYIYEFNDAYVHGKRLIIDNLYNGHLRIRLHTDKDHNIFKYEIINGAGKYDLGFKMVNELKQKYPKVYYSTVPPANRELNGFKGYYPNDGRTKAFIDLVKEVADIQPPPPPQPEPTPVGYKLHLYVDNLTMGQLTLCRPQLEVGTVATDWKPNPNDTLNSVNETVKVITDKVTAIETKVGEIELQVKDNKTTITTIQSDVTKKITEQDNKIASIELKNNSITSTVEDVKNKTTELEGKVTDQAEQIKRVEQKITPEGIQSVVQDKITQAKNEAVEEANNSTDTKLEQYTLKDNFTKFKQDSEKFQLQVSQTGVTNILKNSRPRNFNKDFWYIGYNFHTMYRYFDGTDEATSHENFEGEVFKSGLWFTMWAPTVQNGWLFLANNSIRDYKFNLQKKYTIDFLLYSDNSHTNIYLQVADDNGANQVFYSGNIHLKNGYNRLTYTFTPKVEGNQPNFMIVVNNRNGEDINMYVPWVNFYEGYPITKQHLPDGRGLVDSLTTIDKDGIKCNFGDGTWASMGRQGFAYYTQGMTNPYKYINFTTKLTGIRNGHWVAITLPPCFTRKNINTDFVVQAWAGAIDSNAFAKHQQDAVRNLFIEVGSWNNETRQLFVRPCLQKIGIATKTLFGWDQATTSRGNPIGEGTVDIIVLVQM